MGFRYLDTSILKGVDLFDDLSERNLQEVIVLMTTMEVKQGMPVFSEGDDGDALYLILKGEVRISKNIPGVGEEALAFLPEGSCFGEMSLVEGKSTRSASAISQKSTELVKLSRKDFLHLMETNKDFAVEMLWGFVRILSNRLRNSNDKVTFLAMSNMFE